VCWYSAANPAKDALAGDVATVNGLSGDVSVALNPISDRLGAAWVGGDVRVDFGGALGGRKTDADRMYDEVAGSVQRCYASEPDRIWRWNFHWDGSCCPDPNAINYPPRYAEIPYL
jgi:hypothetical protein